MKFVTSRILEKDQGNIVVHGNTWIGHRSMKLRTGLFFFFFFLQWTLFSEPKQSYFLASSNKKFYQYPNKLEYSARAILLFYVCFVYK